jgi:hypothetical protein
MRLHQCNPWSRSVTPAKSLLAAAVSMALSSAGPAAAEGSASSASFMSITASVGSVSASFGRSSESSSRAAPVANGDYKIIDLAAAPERQGSVRLTLQSVADADSEFLLYLPQAVAAQARLVQGGVVTARPRPYGTEFAYGAGGDVKQAFFLVLADDWYRELQAELVQL